MLGMSLEELMDVTVVAASREKESIQETPVPVTVITRDMIERSGAKNLKDLLVTFVPGFTYAQDHNEVNIGVRGVYGSSQQKILVMRDGHRLNSRAYSEANPDFSIDLDSIQQIEVLRGPGSSLYGNVALTAVINIVTKKGKDIDGVQARAGFGSFKEYRASLVVGKQFDDDHELSIWGSYYGTDGEEVVVPASRNYGREQVDATAILDGFRDPGSYDVGMQYRFGELRLFANTRYSKYVEPFSGGGAPTGQAYRYDDYRTLDGVGPGLGSRFSHLGAGWNHVFKDAGDLEIDAYAYFDSNTIEVALIIDPSITKSGLPRWNEWDIGAIVQARKPYELLGKGNILVGAQADKMELSDSDFPIQVNGEWVAFGDSSTAQLLEPGSEAVFSAFAQIKHRFTDELILNAGIRYDHKNRNRGDDVTNLSPRIAVVWLPSSMFGITASYAQSFVDGPYWYRYNSLSSYRGGEFLKPELLTSAQLTPTITLLDGRLKNTFNVYFSRLSDFIWRNNNALPTEPIYQNAGFLETIGVEEEIAFIDEIVVARANASFLHALDAENYGVTGGRIHSVPRLTTNVIIDFNALHWFKQQLWLNLTLRYIGAQVSPITVNFIDGPNYSDPDFETDAAFLVNVGARWTLPGLEQLTLDLRVYNLFDTEYFQGGSVQHPYPQPGRWWQMSLTGKF